MSLKFIDTWCYLVIGCFDWKIGVFQQTVVRSLLYPESNIVLLIVTNIIMKLERYFSKKYF